MSEHQSDFETLKATLKETWSAGDFGLIARGLEESALAFLDRHGPAPGERMLDVACGAGQLAIPAAARGAAVTGLDIAEPWIAQARRRAEQAGLDIRFDVGDAEDMPYEDESFDLVISLIGAMFAPRPERVTAEMLRVCKPGGRVVMGNWTADGVVGDFFRTIAGYAPPPEGMPSPLLWGDEETVRQRFAEGVSDLRMTRGMLHFDYPLAGRELAEHYLEHFGPTKQAAAKLDAEAREALADDVARLWSSYNTASDGSTQVDAGILEVVAVKA